MKKTSNFWIDFEGERCAYFNHFWTEPESMEYFLENEGIFLKRLFLLCKKYGIAVPLNTGNWNRSFYSFYSLTKNEEGVFVYPTELFVDINDTYPKKIVSIDPLTSLEELDYIQTSSPPFHIKLYKIDEIQFTTSKINKEIQLNTYIDNNIFNFELYGNRTDFKVIDNSELALVNAPRLNSYLRDLKKLCSSFRADKFEFEDLGLEDYCEDGVMFDGEVIYYEDIYDALLPHQQIVRLDEEVD